MLPSKVCRERTKKDCFATQLIDRTMRIKKAAETKWFPRLS